MNSAQSLRYHNWVTSRWQKHLLQQMATAKQAGDAATASQIEQRLAQAAVVEFEDLMPGRVQFGTQVIVFSLDEEEEQGFQIVSDDEAKSGPGLISALAPLAQKLFGAIEGDVVRVILPNGSNCDYEVTHVKLVPF